MRNPKRQTQTNPILIVDEATAALHRIATVAGLLEAAGQGDVVEGKIVRGAGVLITEEVGRVRQLVKRLQAAQHGQ